MALPLVVQLGQHSNAGMLGSNSCIFASAGVSRGSYLADVTDAAGVQYRYWTSITGAADVAGGGSSDPNGSAPQPQSKL